jgi:nicotinate-nucleotide adenylyltransferase
VTRSVTGLFGGAFDPPHNGHRALIEAAIDRFELERVVVVVTGNPPHKEVETDKWIRLELARAAFADMPRVELADCELERDGPSYTIDTARWAATEWEDPIFLVGADEFADFLSWRDPKGILAVAQVGVATRPGYPREALDRVVAELGDPERVHFFEIPEHPISSRELRQRVARGEPIDELVPAAVAIQVKKLGLYRCYAETSAEQGRSTR